MGHVQTTIRKLITWAQVHDLAFRHYKPDWNVLLTLTVDSPFCSNIRHSNEGQLKAVKLEHPLAVIIWLYHRLIFLPIEVRYFFFVFQQYFIWSQALSIPENFAITWPTPTAWPSVPQAYQCLISHFLASLGACSLLLYIHVTIHVVISWQLSKQCIRWPLSPDRIARSGIDPLSSITFLKLSAATFQMIAGSRSIFLKCMWNKLCSWAAPLKFGFQTDLGRENSSREGSRFWLFSPLSRVGHALLLIFMLWLVKIWQVSSCGKCIQHLETCFLIAEAERVLCRQLVTFLTVFFHWMYKMNTAAIKILL